MREIIVLCAFAGFPLVFFAQSYRSPVSDPALGSGAYSVNYQDAFVFAANPAALGLSTEQGGTSAGIAARRRFMLTELNQINAVAAFRRRNAGLSVLLNYAGFSEFNESSAGIGFGRNLGKLSLGMQLNYHRLVATGYDSYGTISADLSLLWQLTEKLRSGIQVINALPRNFGPLKDEKYSSIYKMGIGYEASKSCYLSAEILKETEKDVNVFLSVHYQFASEFFGRIGLNTDVGSPFFAAGWQKRKLRILVTGSYHAQLGFSPGLMISFENPKKD
ncbi:MAG: hypothetical protein EOO02_03465 [Chitinophagaceae bacterium]|nr:MAG: hypothetical protein EOO02_03465 [Chitinophagaceae bacterium]